MYQVGGGEGTDRGRRRLKLGETLMTSSLQHAMTVENAVELIGGGEAEEGSDVERLILPSSAGNMAQR